MAKIILKDIGRGKVNKTIEIEGTHSEEDLAERAYIECKKHVMSSESWLDPNEEKGKGHWKFYVGMGYHVGDVEIIL